MKAEKIYVRYFAILVLAAFLTVFTAGLLFAQTTEGDMKDLQKFMELRTKLQEKIKDSERSKILFSLGEYYYKTNDTYDAKRVFEEYVVKNPGGITALLARVYLYKIAVFTKSADRVAQLKKEIFQEQFILLFDKFKTLSYSSVFGYKYEVHYFVDRIEIYLNGEIFERVSP